MWSRVEKALLGVKVTEFPAVVPGLLLSVGLAVLSIWVSEIIGESVLGYAKSPVSPVMVAILVGLVVGNALCLPHWAQPGLTFAVKKLLRLGIILLGIRLSILDVLQLGAVGIPVVLACIVGALVLTAFLAQRMNLPKRLGTLIGVGTSICGVSAIVAAAPAIDAEEEEVTYAIAVIAVFGMFATVAYPYLANLLFAGNAAKVGIFLGTSIHDTSQVTGAAMVYSEVYSAPRALDIAIVTKLVRNVFMVGVIPVMALYYTHLTGKAMDRRPRLRKLLPVFILGFLTVAVLRSIGDASLNEGGGAFGLWDSGSWKSVIAGVKQWATYFLVVALAGVGMNTRFRKMSRLGIKPFLVGFAAAILVGAISYVMVTILDATVGIEGLGLP